MPFINIRTNVKIDNKQEMQKKLGEIVQIIPGKTPVRTMIQIEDAKEMFFNSNDDPCAMVQTLVNVPTDMSKTKEYCDALMDLLSKEYGIPETRIFTAVNEVKDWYSRR